VICITFDSDHMNDARMREFLATIRIPGSGTFFCTQPYPSLDGGIHEVAPHPYLPEGGAWKTELEAKRREFPQAMGWRSHSCVFSHLLAEWVGKNGYRYVSCHDDLGRADIRPARHAWGVWHFPIYYMDNLDFSARNFWREGAGRPFAPQLIETACTGPGVYVFDFHPIHLLLNTPNAEHYFKVRDDFLKGADIAGLRYAGYGTADFFRELSTQMDAAGRPSITLAAALDRIEARVSA
jgi:hypothetical protein